MAGPTNAAMSTGGQSLRVDYESTDYKSRNQGVGMNARSAKGRRWAWNVMKLVGLVIVLWLVFVFRGNAFKGLVEAGMLLLVGLVCAGIAFLVGWASVKPAETLPVPLTEGSGVAAPRVKDRLTLGDLGNAVLALVVCGALAYTWFGGNRRDKPATTPQQTAVPDLATAAAAKLNQGLPRMTSQDMRLDSVVADPGRALVYNFTVVGWPQMQPMNAQAADSFRSIVLASTCSSSGKDFLAKGIALRNRYRLEDGTVIADVTVAPGDCQRAPDTSG